jgi:hypothetical protein
LALPDGELPDSRREPARAPRVRTFLIKNVEVFMAVKG